MRFLYPAGAEDLPPGSKGFFCARRCRKRAMCLEFQPFGLLFFVSFNSYALGSFNVLYLVLMSDEGIILINSLIFLAEKLRAREAVFSFIILLAAFGYGATPVACPAPAPRAMPVKAQRTARS